LALKLNFPRHLVRAASDLQKRLYAPFLMKMKSFMAAAPKIIASGQQGHVLVAAV
jgi:hypothetical protein